MNPPSLPTGAGNHFIRDGTRVLRLAAGVLLGLAAAAAAPAQQRLYVLHTAKQYHPVVKVSKGRPQLMENGKLVPAAGDRYALRKVDEHLPLFIAVQDQEIQTSGMRSVAMGDTNTNIDANEFHYRAKFEAAYELDDVFLVLELDTANAGRRLLVHEVGRLEPRTPKSFALDLPLETHLGPGQTKLHLFVAGSEVLHSGMPAAYRDEMLDQMIARRVAGVIQAGPKPFYGAAPDYPAVMRQSGIRGEAVVTMRVTARGAVEEARVESATHPAFGEAALAAVRAGRFLPRVEAGHPVETRVSLPFAFEPPAGTQK